MPIEKSPGYKTSDGVQHSGLGAAQRHELQLLLNVDAAAVIDAIMQNAEAVIALLCWTGRKPRAKKPKLGRPRKVKSVAAANGDTQINNNKEKAI